MQRTQIAGNTNTSLLKIIALVFMCADHFGKMLFPQWLEMRCIGRLAFPIYCWCLVVGVCHTRNIWKYGLRLLAVGLVSQPLYMAALDHTWQQPNIFLTLFVGLLGLAAMEERRWYSHIWGPVLALVLAQLLNCDYGWKGVLLIFLLYMARGDKGSLTAVMIAFCLYWGASSSTIRSLFGVVLPFSQIPGLGPVYNAFARLQGLAVLATPFIVCSMPWQVRLNKWVGYALYPAHLAILWIVQIAMQ